MDGEIWITLAKVLCIILVVLVVWEVGNNLELQLRLRDLKQIVNKIESLTFKSDNQSDLKKESTNQADPNEDN